VISNVMPPLLRWARPLRGGWPTRRRPLPRERIRNDRRMRPHAINSLISQRRQLRLKRACQRQRQLRPRPN
jgi:hypothetical protein